MIDKPEVGKSYKLLDKEEYFKSSDLNEIIYNKYFENDVVTIESINDFGDGGRILDFGCNTYLIGTGEYHLFEEVEYISKDENNLVKVTVYGGKYTFIQNKDGSCEALRYGEKWRDLSGDGLTLALAQEIENLQEKINNAKNCLVCAAIGDPFEVCESTLEILEYEE